MTRLEAGVQVGGRYRLQERIGDGGHAEIWAAVDEATQQRVALKFLHPHLCNAGEALVVLRHEASVARQLAHPGVLHTGEPQQDGESYFLPMEYAAGGDLKRLRGVPYGQTVPVLLQVAERLAHAHARGIVHRDIKPGNLLFDAGGNLKLADFGASARIGSARTLAVGSPFSASPQQLAGEPASPLDDVYGLGALAYELLGGQPPYYPDLDALRAAGQPPPLLQPAHPAPPRLVQLVMAMLALEPRERPPDMAAVMAGLREVLLDTQPALVVAEAMIAERAPPVQSPVAAVPGRRLRRVLGWVLALAAVIAVGWVSVERGRQAPAGAPVTAPAAAPAVAMPQGVPQPAAMQAPDAAAVDADPDAPVFASQVQALQQALAEARPAQARVALARARQLRPQAPELAAWQEAVDRLGQVLQRHTAAVREETAGRLQQALAGFEAALAVDPGFRPAREGRERVAAVLAVRADAAARQVALAARRAQDERDAREGEALEQAERWEAARALYQAVLERDAVAAFAREGEARSAARATLDDRMEGYLALPDRLSDRAVWDEAAQVLATARALPGPQGPRLARQLQALQRLLGSYDALVRVTIRSDSRTEVRIVQVGQLGRFASHELALRPGPYTAVGTREGYRDVRIEFTVEPGRHDVALAIACTEQI